MKEPDLLPFDDGLITGRLIGLALELRAMPEYTYAKFKKNKQGIKSKQISYKP